MSALDRAFCTVHSKYARGICATIPLIVMALSISPTLVDVASGAKTETLAMEKAAPLAVAIEAAGSEEDLRRQMRAKNAVTELHDERVRFSQAQIGSFGFIAPQALGMALITQSADLGLERAAPTVNAYEVHKLSDGSGLLVGFMPQDQAKQITPAERPKNLRISLYSTLSDTAPLIVAVPIVKLMVDRMPIRIEPKKSDGPVILEMDLQSTANRKSPVGR